MKYALGNMLNGAGGLNADQLALDLQFAADKTLTARRGPTPVLTRGSTGTFVGSNGLIQTAAVNAARFDHDPVTLASRGLLIEEGRTNLLLQSENIATTWARNGASASTNVDTAPDGSTTADKAVENTSNSLHGVSQSVATVSGSTYIGSIFVKASGRNFAMIYTGSGGGNGRYISIPADGTGTILGNYSANNSTVTLQYLNNGWYRATIVIVASAATSSLELYTSTNGTTAVFTGDGTSGVLAWGGQIELGSFATSYIPTTTSALARSADVCSITGANFTNMWNATEGSLFASAIFHAPSVYSAAQQIVDINDTTTNNRLRVFRTTNGEPGLFQTTAGSTNVQIVSGAISTRTTQNMSAGFKLDDYVLYRNNASIGTDNLGAFIVSPTTMTIGDASSGVGTRAYINGTISAIRYYRKRLANAKLQAFTV